MYEYVNGHSVDAMMVMQMIAWWIELFGFPKLLYMLKIRRSCVFMDRKDVQERYLYAWYIYHQYSQICEGRSMFVERDEDEY